MPPTLLTLTISAFAIDTTGFVIAVWDQQLRNNLGFHYH